MPSPRTQAEALVVLTWNQESVILSDSIKKALKNSSAFTLLNGDPGGIRTPDLLIRSQTLYPAELRSHLIE